MPRSIPIQILPGWRGRIGAPELRRVARHVLKAEDVAAAVEVEIVLAGAGTVRDLNRLYRGLDEATDVLSFGASDNLSPFPLSVHGEGDRGGEVEAAFIEPPDAIPSLGEVVICLPVAEAHASAAGSSVAGEVAHLLVHGLLHLLDYDHEKASDAAAMQSREDELLSALGYAGQYEHGH